MKRSNDYHTSPTPCVARLLAIWDTNQHSNASGLGGVGRADVDWIRIGVISDTLQNWSRNTSATWFTSLFHPFLNKYSLSHLWDDNQFFAFRARRMGCCRPCKYLWFFAGVWLPDISSLECGFRSLWSILADKTNGSGDHWPASRLADYCLPRMGLAKLPTTLRCPISIQTFPHF